MNKTIGVVLVVIVVLSGLSFYLFGDSMLKNASEEMRDHSDELADFEMGPGEVVKKMKADDSVIVLDLRTPEAYDKMHVKDALLLPATELSQKTLSEVGIGADKKNTNIILYDRSGSASKTAYEIMTALGYKNVKSVAGGMVHWQEDSFPMLEDGAYTGPRWTKTVDTSSETTEGPRISFDNDLYDFGVIPQYGGVVKTTFTITNSGTGILEIGEITTSCSCTSADISSKTIEPGEEAILTVSLDPNLHEEPGDVFKRTVFIPTNDPTAMEAEVSIQVDIAEGE